MSAVELDDMLSRGDLPVEDAALWVAADACPGIDRASALSILDELAEPVSHAIGDARDAEDQANLLAARVHEDYGLTGNQSDYYDPRNSYLHEVLSRRTGIPLTLSIIWMAVGRRAGAQVDGIGFPGHFLVRVGGEDGVLADPFHGGRVLSLSDLERLAGRMLGHPGRLASQHLLPVDVRSIVVRLLTNLKHAHERRGDHSGALVASDRLFDVTGRPEHRRDRGLHAFALGSYAAAAADLEAYLAARPTAKDVPALRSALERARQLARGAKN